MKLLLVAEAEVVEAPLALAVLVAPLVAISTLDMASTLMAVISVATGATVAIISVAIVTHVALVAVARAVDALASSSSSYSCSISIGVELL